MVSLSESLLIDEDKKVTTTFTILTVETWSILKPLSGALLTLGLKKFIHFIAYIKYSVFYVIVISEEIVCSNYLLFMVRRTEEEKTKSANNFVWK